MPLINSNLDKINNYGKLQPERCIDVGNSFDKKHLIS